MNITTKIIRTYLHLFQVTGNPSWAVNALRCDEKLTCFIAMEWGILFKLPNRHLKLIGLSNKVVRLK